MKTDPYFTPPVKFNLKWIKNLLLRPEIIKLLEENIGKKLPDMGLSSDFLKITKHKQ